MPPTSTTKRPSPKKTDSKKPTTRTTSGKTASGKVWSKKPDPKKKEGATDANSRPAGKTPWKSKGPKLPFEPDPKDANTVNSIRQKLQQLKDYKRILAEDGLRPDEDDKALESELIKQLIRIEKGLPPKKAPKKVKSKAKRLAEKAYKKKNPQPEEFEQEPSPVSRPRRGGWDE